jgi:hypothetical protein
MAEDNRQFFRRIQQQSRMIEAAIERLRLLNQSREPSVVNKSPLAPANTHDKLSGDTRATTAEPTDV